MKIAILGASRGLGRELVLEIQSRVPKSKLLLMSRKFDLLTDVARDTDSAVACDFSSREGAKLALQTLQEFQPEQIYYVAGGGPYGLYGDKDWKSHEWSLNVTFLFPAQVLHWACSKKPVYLKKFVVIGSNIAEASADPHAASYAAGKHGLRGLVMTLKEEGVPFDLSLFSPGYMATDMLPPGSPPRENGVARDPHEVATELLDLTL